MNNNNNIYKPLVGEEADPFANNGSSKYSAGGSVRYRQVDNDDSDNSRGDSKTENDALITPGKPDDDVQLKAQLDKANFRQRMLGFGIVISITILLSAISELNQYILSTSYNKPYFLVFYNTLYLAFALPIEAVLLSRDRSKERKVPLLNNTQGTSINDEQQHTSSTAMTTTSDNSLLERYKMEYVKAKLPFRKMLIISFCMSVLFVGLNWIWSIGLPLTEVSTSTALYQSATIWVFVFSIFILKDKPTPLKIVSIVLFIGGVVGITLADRSSSNSTFPKAVLGDILMIVSAVLWALYEVLTTKFVGEVSRTLVNSYVGFIALWNVVFGVPMLIIISVSGLEPWETPSWTTFGMLTASASVSFMLNYLINWGLSVTSPLFVRSGELMTIPTTLIFDIIIKHVPFPPIAIPGFLCIIGGFIVMLYVENKHMKEKAAAKTLEQLQKHKGGEVDVSSAEQVADQQHHSSDEYSNKLEA
ncbi:hypothetical protein SAMD00019534_063560 [Acytostelium subglobosum LB1]|uniref:hypothetical protein n=1 Tax=Acytostelium subglobosum LB1 TaxID=1410327 RepID=UPI0006448DB9|nr:hypothetical protein SAMD00019534_063560 [Acytostelium subglobosum LB1]GAM23181.1 hypothetical protein SAMD00019534_063560 [Acytostelium subglobosum LB1]|eukprot:XP_012753630.1 hypothetical protein SAMD00019534_063560 [Acytostelium subglobosum LB1]